MRSLIVLGLAAAAGDELASTAYAAFDQSCWLNSCGAEAEGCAATEPCRTHLSCADDCFKGLSFAQLSEHELKLFHCARAQGCVDEKHPSMSFLEEAMHAKGLPTMEGIDIKTMLHGIQAKMLGGMQGMKDQLATTLDFKKEIEEMGDKYIHLHKDVLEGRGTPESLAEMKSLDTKMGGLQSKMQEEVAKQDANADASAEDVQTLPLLGMILSSTAPKDAKGQVDPSSLLQLAKMLEPPPLKLDIPEAGPIDLQTTPAIGMQESLKDWIGGLGGDTDALMAEAQKAAAADAPHKEDYAKSFRDGYLTASKAINLPATEGDAEKALHAVAGGNFQPAALVEARQAKNGDAPKSGADMVKDTLEHLKEYGDQVDRDFPETKGKYSVDANANLRDETN